MAKMVVSSAVRSLLRLHRPAGADVEGGGFGAEAALLGRVWLLPAASSLRADEREGEVLLHRPQSHDISSSLISHKTLNPNKTPLPRFKLFIVFTLNISLRMKSSVSPINVWVKCSVSLVRSLLNVLIEMLFMCENVVFRNNANHDVINKWSAEPTLLLGTLWAKSKHQVLHKGYEYMCLWWTEAKAIVYIFIVLLLFFMLPC